MILGAQQSQNDRKTFVDLPANVRTLACQASIKLTGPAKSGGTFTGSGALLWSDGTNTTLVTAKHNLYAWAGIADQPPWDDALATQFQNAVTVSYDATDWITPRSTGARLTAVNPIPPGERSWSYDVVLLTSDDANLAQYAAHGAQLFPGIPPPATISLLCSSQQYLARRDAVFLQVGFGAIDETVTVGRRTVTLKCDAALGVVAGSLQYRVAEPFARTSATVYNQRSDTPAKYDEFEGAVQLGAMNESSTAPGDSGGPLFCCTAGQLLLVGVATGSDMALAPVPCPPAGATRFNNIATSLESCYRNQQSLVFPSA